MQLPDNLIVLDIAGKRAVLDIGNPLNEAAALSLGFIRDGSELVRPIVNDTDRASLIVNLIELEALFSGGHDWSPAELVDFYHEQGRINQRYKVISWRDKENYIITQKDI